MVWRAGPSKAVLLNEQYIWPCPDMHQVSEPDDAHGQLTIGGPSSGGQISNARCKVLIYMDMTL